jgi:hypothetical protein
MKSRYYCQSISRKKILYLVGSTIIIPILSTVIALVGILSGVYLQTNSTQAQIRMNQFEVTFNAKQQGYADLMATMQNGFFSSMDGNRDERISHTDKLHSLFFSIEPFISTADLRNQLWNEMQEIIFVCNHTCDAVNNRVDTATIDDLVGDYIQKRDSFSQKLRNVLFPNISP